MNKMNKIYKIIVLTLVLTPKLSFGAPLGYMDADNATEAVGILKVSMHSIYYLRDICISKIPVIKDQINTNLSTWEKLDSKVINNVEQEWVRIKNPSLINYLTASEEILDNSFKTFEKMPEVSGQSPAKLFCINYFSQLANGEWSKKTPNAYNYMNK